MAKPKKSPTPTTIEAYMVQHVGAALVGRRIVRVDYLSEEGTRDMAICRRPPVLVLDDGTVLVIMSDAEGNDAGALHGTTAKGEPVVLPPLGLRRMTGGAR